MTEVVLTKRATASNGRNSLENFSKLNTYASQGSVLAKRQARENGIAFTIIKNGKIYKVHPDGREVEVNRNQLNDENIFEPIRVAN